jgi:hypothetical protein
MMVSIAKTTSFLAVVLAAMQMAYGRIGEPIVTDQEGKGSSTGDAEGEDQSALEKFGIGGKQATDNKCSAHTSNCKSYYVCHCVFKGYKKIDEQETSN